MEITAFDCGCVWAEGEGPVHICPQGRAEILIAELERKTMTAYLTRDTILQREDIKTVEVECPEWGGTVLVRGMSGVERDKFEASLVVEDDSSAQKKGGRRRRAEVKTTMDNIRAKICVWCMVDEQGNRLFTEADVAELGKKSAAPLDRVYDRASKLSGITEDDVEEMAQKMVEDPFDETSSP